MFDCGTPWRYVHCYLDEQLHHFGFADRRLQLDFASSLDFSINCLATGLHSLVVSIFACHTGLILGVDIYWQFFTDLFCKKKKKKKKKKS